MEIPVLLRSTCNAPLPILADPLVSVARFSPGHFRRRTSRPVSYYALFEWMAASEPTSWRSEEHTSVVKSGIRAVEKSRYCVICTRTGISTCYPSTTPFGLALGPDLPRADQLYSGNLRYSAGRILTFLSPKMSGAETHYRSSGMY